MGNNNEIFKILTGVNLISFKEGYKLKYLNGVTISSPIIMSITRRIRNDFHISFRKSGMDLISNCIPWLGFFRYIVKSRKSNMYQLKIDKSKESKANIEKCN